MITAQTPKYRAPVRRYSARGGRSKKPRRPTREIITLNTFIQTRRSDPIELPGSDGFAAFSAYAAAAAPSTATLTLETAIPAASTAAPKARNRNRRGRSQSPSRRHAADEVLCHALERQRPRGLTLALAPLSVGLGRSQST